MKRDDAHLRIRLGPSRHLAAFLVAAHAGALACALAAALPVWLDLACLALVAASLAHSLRRHAWLRAGGAVVGLDWRADRGWDLRTRAGRTFPVILRAGGFVSPWLIVLGFRMAGRRSGPSVVIAGDAIGGDAHRRLRVHLRHGPALDEPTPTAGTP